VGDLTEPDIKRMRLRYAGICACGTNVAAGTPAGWDRAAHRVVCPSCLDGLTQAVAAAGPAKPTTQVAPIPVELEPEPSPAVVGVGVDVGVAGASARAEHARRVAKRENRIRQAHPKLGGLILALTDDPQSTKAWGSGGVGEAKVGARLEELGGSDVLVLHDRRIPGTRANIDHLAVGPAGVYVIDAKRYVDAKVEVRRSGGLFRPVAEQLYVGGRDRTKLVTGLAPQVAAVYDALAGIPGSDDTAVFPVLAFVDSLLPLFGSLEIAGVPVVGPKGAAKLARRPGPLDAERRAVLQAALAAALPGYQR
jgi:hypothetical protein